MGKAKDEPTTFGQWIERWGPEYLAQQENLGTVMPDFVDMARPEALDRLAEMLNEGKLRPMPPTWANDDHLRGNDGRRLG